LYSYARNNPLSYIDPRGNSIELLGDAEERKKALAFLQKSLGNDKAASSLYINEKRLKFRDHAKPKKSRSAMSQRHRA
jgi:hypothetical protein